MPDPQRCKELDWGIRLKMISGIAKISSRFTTENNPPGPKGVGTLLFGDGLTLMECFRLQQRLDSYMKEEEFLQGIDYPPISKICDITKEVAATVVREADAGWLAEGYRDMNPRELARLSEEEAIDYVKNNMWNPVNPIVVCKD